MATKRRRDRLPPYNPLGGEPKRVVAPPKPPPADARCVDCGRAEPESPEHHLDRLVRCGLDKKWRCGWCVGAQLRAAIAADPYTREKRTCADCGVQGCVDGTFGEAVLWFRDHRDGNITVCVTCRRRRIDEADAEARARQAERRRRRTPRRTEPVPDAESDADADGFEDERLYRPPAPPPAPLPAPLPAHATATATDEPERLF